MSKYFQRKAHPQEDALTGMLADILDWFDADVLLRKLLGDAEHWDPSGGERPRGVALPAWTRYSVETWPSWSHGEPDMVVRLWSESDQVNTVVIEAKFGAGKSNQDLDSNDVSDSRNALDARTARDQLAKYYLDARAMGAGDVRVVYLTEHALPPHDELKKSLDEIRKYEPAASPLYWLGWRDVEGALEDSTEWTNMALAKAASSMGKVLRRLGLFRFSGAWSPREGGSMGAPPARLFWTRTYCWACGEIAAPPPMIFYREHR